MGHGRWPDEPKIVKKGTRLYIRFRYRPVGSSAGQRICIRVKLTEREAERRKRALVEDWIAKHPNGIEKPTEANETGGERGLVKVWELFVADVQTDPERKRPASDAWIHILKQHGRLFAKTFATVDELTSVGIQRHRRDRLAKIRRTTLSHELYSLQVFLRWCERKGIIASAPKFTLPARDDRKKPLLEPDEVRQLLAAIPETVDYGPTRGRPLRPFFEVMYYQGLRDRTVYLLTWDDYNHKTGELHIRKEIDKNKYERTFKAFPETRAALDALRPNIVPRGTFIFGPAKRWSPIKKAAVKVGLAHKTVSEHSLRHARTTELCARPDADPAAVAYILGWRDVSTLFAKYFHPTKRHADAFVDKVSRAP